MTEPAEDPPVPEELAAEIREALSRVRRGEAVDLGDFSQYTEGYKTD